MKNDAIPITKEYLWEIVLILFEIGALIYNDSSPLIIWKNHFATKTSATPKIIITAKLKYKCFHNFFNWLKQNKTVLLVSSDMDNKRNVTN